MFFYIRLFILLSCSQSCTSSVYEDASEFVTETLSTSYNWFGTTTGVLPICPFVDNAIESLNKRSFNFLLSLFEVTIVNYNNNNENCLYLMSITVYNSLSSDNKEELTIS
jgi:hypothetical protein